MEYNALLPRLRKRFQTPSSLKKKKNWPAQPRYGRSAEEELDTFFHIKRNKIFAASNPLTLNLSSGLNLFDKRLSRSAYKMSEIVKTESKLGNGRH